MHSVGDRRSDAGLPDMICCPRCRGPLELADSHVLCTSCGQSYLQVEGVLILQYPPEDINKKGLMDIVGELITFRLDK